MSRFLNKEYEKLQPYTPGEQPRQQKLIKLNTNENPYGPSPKVMEAISRAEVEKLMLYPDPTADSLKEAIAHYYGVEKEQVIAGNGSDEILAFCFMAFQKENKKYYFPEISYGFYPVYGQVFSADWKGIPLNRDLTINVKDFRNLDGNIVIANPNAPTGIPLEPREIQDIIESNRNNLVIIDEAYVDFGGKSCVPFVEKYDNLLIVQTFSKSRSLAGSRVGFAIGNKELIGDLERIRFSFNPYNLNRLSILAAVEAIKDDAYFRETQANIIATRDGFIRRMQDLGFEVLPSAANFVFVKHPGISGKEYFLQLGQRNILVRHFDKEPICDYVRITIGREQDMEILLQATRELLKEG